MEKRRAVFLDRDGVLNQAYVKLGKPYPPASLEETQILPGVLEALEKLRSANFLTIVVTNQPDVANGKTPRQTVEAINAFLSQKLALDAFHVCFHNDNDQCQCRKPAPGLLLAASHEHNIDLQKSYIVGDRWRDIEAGRQAGCKTFFIDYGYQEKQPEEVDYRVQSLSEASRIILGE